jgi:hypothetical protein
LRQGVPRSEHDDQEKRRARDRFGKFHALSVVRQAIPVSELDHVAAKLDAGIRREEHD